MNNSHIWELMLI